MSEPTAQRTLVKSPPELWAEISDVESLARHLGELGEIRITRVEPETTVAWEGDRASGTVELEPSGWGTKVTLTATPTEAPGAAEALSPAPEPEAPVAAIAEPEGAVEPEGVAEPEPAEPEPAPVAAPEFFAIARPEPVEPVLGAPLTANEMLTKSGFFSRMFGRGRPQGEIGGPSVPTPMPTPPTPMPTPNPPAPDPRPPTPTPVPDPAPDPQPPPPTPAPDPLPAPTPLPPREPDPEPPAAAEAQPPLDLERVLTEVLDNLGAAHHRPFSR